MSGIDHVKLGWELCLARRCERCNACFIVRDANGQALADVYFEDEPGRRIRNK